MPYTPDSTLFKRKKLAWSIATTVCLQSKEDPVLIYNRLMKEFEKDGEMINTQSKCASCESCKLQEDVTAGEDCSP